MTAIRHRTWSQNFRNILEPYREVLITLYSFSIDKVRKSEHRLQTPFRALDYQQQRREAGPGHELNEKEFPSVLIPLFKTYKWTFLSGAFFKFIFDLLQFVAPHLLKQLITFIQVPNSYIVYFTGRSPFPVMSVFLSGVMNY